MCIGSAPYYYCVVILVDENLYEIDFISHRNDFRLIPFGGNVFLEGELQIYAIIL